ncbi:MAG TPA: penicillin-binding transpeptidase domain-containing protein [Xanthomonadaceae bacterium]|nr:penicillin-binding transpeptidase domain-containing protein [Xanthomonadaceae bacterium]
MLESVVGSDGTAQLAAIPNYRVAGKTGTSRRAVAGGYQSRYISVFAGMVPASRPRMVAVVVLHDPAGEHYYAGLVAAPAFSRIMDGALRLLDVPPDDVRTWYAAAPLLPAGGGVEDYGDMAETVAEAPQEGLL